MKGRILILIISATLAACSEGDLPSTEETKQASVAPLNEPAPQIQDLSIQPSLASINIKQTTSFVATGGVSPYTYAVVGTSAGTLSNNVFTASIVGETVRVRVTDSRGLSAETSASVAWPAMVEIVRGKNASGYHFYSNNPNDATFASFNVDKRVGYRLLQNPIDDKTKPLYRCVYGKGGVYFNSDKADCENVASAPGAYQNQGILGYTYRDAQPGLVRIQRFAGTPPGGFFLADHVDSITGASDPEVGGFNPEGSPGYALAPQ